MTPKRFTERDLHEVWARGEPPVRLHSTDGRSVTVLEPGTPNHDGGPDFRDALIRIGSTLYRGDVELHLHSSSWEKHLHHRDTHYNSVILHVVLTHPDGVMQPATASGRPLPVAVVKPVSVPRSAHALSRDEFACHRCLGRLPAQVLLQGFRVLGQVRLERKVTRYEGRLTEILRDRGFPPGGVLRGVGIMSGFPDPPLPRGPSPSPWERADPAAWDQLFYEGLFEALGYEKNRVACAALARTVPLRLLRRIGLDDTEAVQGVLFGAAGLLPSSRGLPDKESRQYVRRLRRHWRTWRAWVRGPLLHESDWLFFRLRPANFPTARIAAMSYLLPGLFTHGCMHTLVRAIREPVPADRWRALRMLFRLQPGQFWRSHIRFQGRGCASGVRLGDGRIVETATNVVIPLVLLAARMFGDGDLETRSRELLDILPPPPTNRLLRSLPAAGISPPEFSRAAVRQGIIELAARRSDAGRCNGCPFRIPTADV